MLEETKLSKWWNGLPENHKKYLESQPIWYDRDLFKAVAVGIVIGFIVGLIVGYDIGVPEAPVHQLTYIRG